MPTTMLTSVSMTTDHMSVNGTVLNNAVQVLPPLPHLNSVFKRGHFPRELPPRARRPPDYNVAAQMARMARLSRAHSHEGVASYYNNSDPEEDDDDEAQVSAV